MSNSKLASEIHQQYCHQSTWTAATRDYLLRIAGVKPDSRILEVGCGTGAILEDLHRKTQSLIFGIDIDYHSVLFAKNNLELNFLTVADGHLLPFPDQTFDSTLCHYFLLWVHDKNRVIHEMIRVTRSGGTVIAFAEPDHRSRIDYPANLEEIGRFQNLSLINQGADISAGRKLYQLFSSNGLINVTYGVYANEVKGESTLEAHCFEWNYLKDDLSVWLDSNEISQLMELDRQAYLNHQRVLFIPTFWAIGWVKHPIDPISP